LVDYLMKWKKQLGLNLRVILKDMHVFNYIL